jgi:hypothetical protein
MNYLKKIIEAIELHDVEEIKQCFANGIDPNSFYNDQPLLYELTSEYTRTARFKDCVKAFVEAGLFFEDKVLLAVLLDDTSVLETALVQQPELIHKKFSLKCAYTPLHEVTLLHICAEFNQVSCARSLIAHGANVNATAGIDEHGFGGQTAIFHTVNQNNNNSIAMLNFLLAQKTDLDITVKGITWGKGYTWQTFIPAVNPLSYAMMGLLPQMHRDEVTIANTISLLLKVAFDINYVAENVPCDYLK